MDPTQALAERLQTSDYWLDPALVAEVEADVRGPLWLCGGAGRESSPSPEPRAAQTNEVRPTPAR